MPSSTVRLPDGQTFTVQPVFAGLFFKSHELNKNPQSPFPIGWTIVIHTEEDGRPSNDDPTVAGHGDKHENGVARSSHIHSFTKPTLQTDSLYISSISNPSSADFKPAASPTRQIAMMLWITLYWYFHQPAPDKTLPPNENSKYTPPEGRPKGDWRINIKRDGVLRGRNLIPKLERMGLIATLDSAVGSAMDDTSPEWANMFVSQRMFWQIPGRLFLFTLQPTNRLASSHPGSPISSRPTSPVRDDRPTSPQQPSSPNFHLSSDLPGAPPPQTIGSVPSFPTGPFYSSSHLPTYYPPAPLHYTFTNDIRHPVRPKPPRMGEVFYSRFVPSVGKYLSLRVASSSPKPVPYLGPVSCPTGEEHHLTSLCDIFLVQKWLNNARVAKFWGGYVPNFLNNALASRHSFPAIGMWDGVPFGYFEIYWVKEDQLGRHIDVDDWDRGIHVFIGEEWARGVVQSWLSALVHWIFCADYRTQSVCIEPRVDNEIFIQHLQAGGFIKEKEVTFPHKQSWFGQLRRENWEGPTL
ncbi:aerobactin siderophore biosynthesis protein iucB [Diaporthe helianthi]|uniref:Aerobactin siderophore biosynthesis protein iucB n=1 Tax=Diaporthe helianthi TaxID=158607 RepID=A0A2P5HHE8_DIAHE|nr:aerobactin siderophore biosynthesis protein iucB [Diaporthe helianthi]